MAHYPEMDTIPTKVTQMQKAGYIPIATFIISEDCWTKHFFAPQHEAQKKFLAKYVGNKIAEDFVASQRYGEELYHKYKDFYGYVFYIGRKL